MSLSDITSDFSGVQKQKLALAEELLQRRKNDPLTLFEPHPKQARFIESVLLKRARENWFIAANRAGKSDAGAYVGAAKARFGDQAARFVGAKSSTIQVRDTATSGWVVSLDFPASRDIVQPKYFDNGFVPPSATHAPFIPEREIIEWRQGDQILKLKNGSLIGFKSCESGAGKFQGAGKEWIHFDEEPPYNIYEECTIRVEGGQSLQIFGTCTILPPEGAGGGISWLFDKIIRPWQARELVDTQLFGASIYDNPHVLRSELDRLESVYIEGSIARRIRLNGEWLPGLSGSRAYASFDSMLNVGEHPPINLYRPLIWTLDFNVEPMCSLIGQRDGPLFRIYKELYLDEGSTPDAIEAFYNWAPPIFNEVWIYGDATSQRRVSQTGVSDYTLIQNELRNHRIANRLKIPEVNPRINDRINAVNSACRYQGDINLRVDPSCRELISDLEQVLRSPDGAIKKVKNKKDPYFKRTHLSDALGYWISYEAPVRLQANTEKPRGVAGGIPTPTYHQ